MKEYTDRELEVLKKKPFFFMTPEEKDAVEYLDDDWEEARALYCSPGYYDSEEYKDNFYDRYPNCPRQKFLHRFSLEVDKSVLREVANGKRKKIMVPFNEETQQLLIDPRVGEFYQWAKDHHDLEAISAYDHVYDPLVYVETVHLHDKTNQWYVDATCCLLNCECDNSDYAGSDKKICELDAADVAGEGSSWHFTIDIWDVERKKLN